MSTDCRVPGCRFSDRSFSVRLGSGWLAAVRCWASLIALCFLSNTLPLAADELSAEFGWQQAQAFLHSYCIDCHQGDESEADFDVDSFAELESLASQRKHWRSLLTRVRESEMPPRDSEQPPAAEREQFSAWLKSALHQSACGDGITPAPALSRRLNRDEYGNTVRDLLNIHVNVSLTLPADGAGGEGFDNAAETLFISPIHAEKYLESARAALDHAFKDKRARELLSIQDDATSSKSAEQVLQQFLPRAFRRPVTPTEVANYLDIFEATFQQTASYTASLQNAMAAAMISPHFLFRIETPNDTAEIQPLTDEELASRLSYFLWASMPDEELLQLAAAGKLHDPPELEQQVRRMLGGGKVGRSANKAGGFAKSFIEQWLGTRALGREFKPDPKITRGRYTSELEGAMKYEPVLFFEEILVNDLSVLNCLDADFTYANKSLAKHYRLKGEFREQPRRVELPKDSHRGGLLGMSAVLAVSSYPHRTSPVLRGQWILETLLGTPTPPPPPDVPELDETVDFEKPQSLRDKLETHRQKAECAVCHDRLDPLGFGLENYDVLGRWRRIQSGKIIDSRGRLPDGHEFKGPQGLKDVLLSRKVQFAEHLTAKMLGFGLGRSLRDEDYCAVDQIVDALKASDYSSHALILGIVNSQPFLYKQSTQVTR